jgi:hypothetical protein
VQFPAQPVFRSQGKATGEARSKAAPGRERRIARPERAVPNEIAAREKAQASDHERRHTPGARRAVRDYVEDDVACDHEEAVRNQVRVVHDRELGSDTDSRRHISANAARRHQVVLRGIVNKARVADRGFANPALTLRRRGI